MRMMRVKTLYNDIRLCISSESGRPRRNDPNLGLSNLTLYIMDVTGTDCIHVYGFELNGFGNRF